MYVFCITHIFSTILYTAFTVYQLLLQTVDTEQWLRHNLLLKMAVSSNGDYISFLLLHNTLPNIQQLKSMHLLYHCFCGSGSEHNSGSQKVEVKSSASIFLSLFWREISRDYLRWKIYCLDGYHSLLQFICWRLLSVSRGCPQLLEAGCSSQRLSALSCPLCFLNRTTYFSQPDRKISRTN